MDTHDVEGTTSGGTGRGGVATAPAIEPEVARPSGDGWVGPAAAPPAGPPLRPMGLPLALLFFGIPSAVFSLFLLVGIPWMLGRGMSAYHTFLIAFSTPLALMLAAAFVAYRLEGRPWTWPAFRDRMRLQRMSGRDWLWTLGLCLFIALVSPMLGRWAQVFAPVVFYHQPAAFADFMKNFATATAFQGVPYSWGLFFMYTITMLVLNMGGEEFWWRGYILPRQELAHGGWAWVVNGTLWAMFHAFYHWNLASLVGMLPVTLAIAFVAQRTKNTWPGFIGHFVGNFGVPLLMLKALL